MPIINFDMQVAWSQFSFTSSKPTGIDDDAQIKERIIIDGYRYRIKKGQSAMKIIEVDVKMALIPGDCWVLTGKNSNGLLKHEQGHHDILALGAREVYNALIGLERATEQELRQEAARLLAGMEMRVAPVNLRYDNQTNHSLDTTRQQFWNGRISDAKIAPKGMLADLPT
jgi:hypothetical protein